MNPSCNLQTGLMDDGVKLNLLASWMALFVIFAGRKFTQPIKVPSRLIEQIILLMLLIFWAFSDAFTFYFSRMTLATNLSSFSTLFQKMEKRP